MGFVGTIQYRAFISYSHQDERWARWLQRSLENYRIPRRLIGTKGEFGAVTRNLRPVFRDREDLPSASDLTSKVQEALGASESLIVICSPATASSHWVNEEILHFRKLGRGNRILALIVDGDPVARDQDQRCFPDALTTDESGLKCEPLAADVRNWADGKLLAKLKIISGMLGIRLDELRRRDQQKRRKIWAVAGLATALVLALTLTLAVSAISSRQATLAQRTNTEELLNYMLGNLKQLDPIVGLEVVDQGDEQLLEYIDSLEFYNLEDDQLVEWGLAWRDKGIEHHEHGNLDEAMQDFQKSRAAFIELHLREGSTRRALFELGQAEFWVGYVHYDRGDLDEAEESFVRYGAITRRLVNADPKDAELVMELAYTLTNLGALEKARQNPDSEKALRLHQASLQYNQIALVLDPGNTTYRRSLANKLAFLADAWLQSCDLGKAFDFRRQNVVLLRQLNDELPDDYDLKIELAYALSGLASVQSRIPLAERALRNLAESHDLLNQLAEDDPENDLLRWQAMMRMQRMLQIRVWTDAPETIWLEMTALLNRMETFQQKSSLEDFEASVEFAGSLIDLSQLAWSLNKQEEAEKALNNAAEHLSWLVREKPENREGRQQLARVLFEEWARQTSVTADIDTAVLDDYLVDPENVKSCRDAGLAAGVALMQGRIELAKEYTDYLLGKGFYEPRFVSFCRRHSLCE